MPYEPNSPDPFDRSVAFYRSAGISAASRGLSPRKVLTEPLLRNDVPRRDRVAIRAARLLTSRSGGSWRTQRLDEARHEFDNPPVPGEPSPHVSDE